MKGAAQGWLTSVEFVYGDRPDPFSEYHAGFEVRTVRRCTEIQVKHNPTLSGGLPNPVVKRYKLTYLDERVANNEVDASLLPLNGVSLLARVQVVGVDDSVEEALPPLDFGYSTYEPLKRDFKPVGGEELPAFSLAQPDMELVDLFGRGLPDVVQLNGTARYWRNLGDGKFALPRKFRNGPVGVHLGDPNVALVDANGNGTADLLVQKPGLSGYYPMRFNGEWEERAFVRHKTVPTFSLADPEVKMLDLDGDGVTDVLRNGSRFEIFFNDRELGFHELKVVNRGAIEDFPEVSFSDPRVRIANICGGMPTICMIYQGRIDYWPHMGRGVWGKRVTMKNSPRFPDRFNPAHVIVGDLDGDGYDDVVYVGHDSITVWINQSGNGFAEPFVVRGTPPFTDRDAVRIVDILGTGCAGLLWSGLLGGGMRDEGGGSRMAFLDLCGGQKPYLLHEMANSLGALTRVEYLPSTFYYNKDYADRKLRWVTPLPFPVLCVARVEVVDQISFGKLTTEYSYHHGYWDGEEREFRGFGRVDQRDTETFSRYHEELRIENGELSSTGAQLIPFNSVEPVHFSPPTETRTWFHLGPVVGSREQGVGGSLGFVEDWVEADFSHEYWSGDGNVLSRPAPMANFLKSLPAKRRREALRTLRGSVLRSELYALDGSSRADRPYTVSENQTGVAQVVYMDDDSYQLSFDGSTTGSAEPIDLGKYWIFFPHGVSSRSSAWERGAEPMTSVSFQWDYDNYGHALQSLSLAVPRTRCLDWGSAVTGPAEPFLGTCSSTVLVHKDDATHYIIGRPVEATSHEIVNDGEDSLWDIAGQVMASSLTSVTLELIGHSLTYYDGDDLTPGQPFEGLAFGNIGEYGIPVRTLQLVLTDGIMADAYGGVVDYVTHDAAYMSTNWTGDYPVGFQSTVADFAGYVPDPFSMLPTKYYVATMRAKYDFYDTGLSDPRGLVLESMDPLGNVSSVEYDDYNLLPFRTTDALGMQVEAVFDYRLMQPRLVTDPNGNRSAVRFSPLGFVVEAGVMGKYGDADGDWDSETASGPDFVPSSIMEYDLDNWMVNGLPAYVKTTQHEWHINDLGYTTDTLVQKAYSDGFGRVVQTRAQAEEIIFGDQDFGDSGLPASQGSNGNAVGVENTSTTNVNVVVNGFKTTNNKELVVEQWEPFYSTGWDYQPPSHLTLQGLPAPGALPSYYGQKVVMYYDSLGRAVRTVNPDGTEQRVVTGVPGTVGVPVMSAVNAFEPTPWESYTYDANDLAPITHPSDTTVPSGHHFTPRSVVVDALGRTVKTTDRNWDGSAVEEVVMTYFFDIRGNKVRVDDAIKNTPSSSRTDSAFVHVYDLANQPLKTTHIDKGTSTVVINAAGLPVEMRDAKGAVVLNSYDELNRPVSMWARDNGGESVTMRQHVVYDVGPLTNPEDTNHMGRPYKTYDEAGMVRIMGYDFKGQPLEKRRRVIKDSLILSTMPSGVYRVDWDGLLESTVLDAKEYLTEMEYDALGRPVSITLPEDVTTNRKEINPVYNRAGAMTAIKLDNEEYVSRIAYNARGQRILVAYDHPDLNAPFMTRYAYDPVNFRLLRQKTEDYVESSLTFTPQSGSTRQDCAYSYDLAGNIVGMADDSPSAGLAGASGPFTRGFDYDALYRLVYASGREAGSHVSSSDPNFRPTPDTSVGGTVAYYREYSYDKLGNMLDLYHHGGTGNQFHRVFNSTSGSPYELSNLCEDIEYAGTVVSYTFDSNGNMLTEGAGRSFEWDYGDRMRWFEEGTTTAAYLYDGGGNRVKKVVRKSSSLKEVTVYIDGGFEYLYTLDGTNTVGDETNEVHVMDGRSRVARVKEFSATTWSGSTADALRYNLEDHLGNAAFTLDEMGSLTNREEYFPFGETSFGSYARKRYRFCGKERDEESGLYYYGARYYAPWACRFVSIDPLAGEYPFYSPFQYAGNQPINSVDLDGLEKDPETNTGGAQVASGEDMEGQANNSKDGSGGSEIGTSTVTLTATEVEPAWKARKRESDAVRAVHRARTANMDIGQKIGYWLEQWTGKQGGQIGSDPNTPLAKVVRFVCMMAYKRLLAQWGQIPSGSKSAPNVKGSYTIKGTTGGGSIKSGSPKEIKLEIDDFDSPEMPAEKSRRRKRDDEPLRYLTYTKYNSATGKTYSGRTRGRGTVQQILAERDRKHHMKGFDAAQVNTDEYATMPFLLRYLDPVYLATRGREQQLIDYYGGAILVDNGTSANVDRAVAKDNKWGRVFDDAAEKLFGRIHDYTGF